MSESQITPAQVSASCMSLGDIFRIGREVYQFGYLSADGVHFSCERRFNWPTPIEEIPMLVDAAQPPPPDLIHNLFTPSERLQVAAQLAHKISTVTPLGNPNLKGFAVTVLELTDALLAQAAATKDNWRKQAAAGE